MPKIATTKGAGRAVRGGHSEETMFALVKAGGDLAKVARIRQALRSGTYENELKLSVAIDRMIERGVVVKHEGAEAPRRPCGGRPVA